MKRHYIYCIEETYTKEFYWGSRSCNCEPEKDYYMGSMTQWKPNKTNLIKTIIIEYETRELTNLAEEIIIAYYIDKKKFPLNRNYHIPNNGFCMLGTHRSEEAKNKQSKCMTGRYLGRKHTDEARKKISMGSTGKKLSDEHKKHISDVTTGKNNGMFNKTQSEETKEKIRQKAIGRKCTEEHKKKISEASSKHKHTDEEKRKIGESHKGMKHTIESKKKMSDSHKGKPGRIKSDEERFKISIGNKGKIRSAEIRKKLSDSAIKRKQEVLQYTLDNIFIAEYSSITLASIETGIIAAAISANCRNKSKSAGGFIWKYKIKQY